MHNDSTFDKVLTLSACSLIFTLFAVLAIKQPCSARVDVIASGTSNSEAFRSFDFEIYPKIKRSKHTEQRRYEATFEEHPGEEYNSLFYATVPIGRYYITAYNDKETGSKITASGKTVHEGTITTCAADPKYHKFGEYLEIGGRLYIVEDTGSAVKRRHIDLYFKDYKAMSRYNSHYETIYRVEFHFGKPGQN